MPAPICCRLSIVAAICAVGLLARVTTLAESVAPPRFTELVKRSSVFVVTAARLNVDSHADQDTATTWHAFRVLETLSTFSGDLTDARERCRIPAPEAAPSKGELLLPFSGGRVAGSFPREWQRFIPAIGTRYLVVVTVCGDGVGMFPFGPAGLFELDSSDRIKPNEYQDPISSAETQSIGSLTRMRALIADLAAAASDSRGLLVGRTVDAATGNPVGGVALRLRGADTQAALSTSEGWFVFRDLPPFAYEIDARKDGWVRRDAGNGAVQVRLEPGERRGDVLVPMSRTPTFGGVVTDEERMPIVGAEVTAYRLMDGQAPRRIEQAWGGRTDDRGHYVIENLRPGDYLVAVTVPTLLGAEPSDQTRPSAYPPTIYPSATTPSAASIVTARENESPVEVNFLVQPVVLPRITGLVRGSEGPLGGASVRLRLVDRSIDIDAKRGGFGSRAARTSADGTFAFDDVVPGQYVVELAVRDMSPDGWPRSDVSVTDRDVGSVRLIVTDEQRKDVITTRPEAKAAQSRGSSRVAGEVREVSTGHPLRRTLVTLTQTATGTARRVETDERGRFLFAGVLDGPHTLSAARDGYLPIALRQGDTASDVKVTVANGGPDDQLLVMAQAGVITGVVIDESGTPSPGVGVELRLVTVENGVTAFRRMSSPPGVGKILRAGLTDSQGRYRYFGLPAGTYIVSAPPTATFDSRLRQFTSTDIERARSDVQSTPTRNLGSPGQPSTARGASRPAEVRAVSPQGSRVPIYHPATPDIARATRVEVTPGRETSVVDIQVTPVSAAAFTVRAQLVAPAGRVGGNPLGTLRRSDILIDPDITIYQDGASGVIASNVPPGRYTLTVRMVSSSRAPEDQLSGSVDVEVVDQDLDVQLPLHRRAEP